MIGQILWQRNGGYWLFWTSALYLTIGLYCVIYYKDIPAAAVQLPWLFAISGPLLFPPLGRWLNMSVDWDIKMLNWFKNKRSEEAKDNVYNLPAPKAVPQVEPPKQEEPAKIFYRLGLTDNNRVAFSMGYSEITMNWEGCQQMIDQITFFQSQLRDEDGNNPDNDPDGGLPLPAEQDRKAA